MAVEIERRFLVHGDDWRSHLIWQAHLRQGYVSSDDRGLTVRVRTSRSECSGSGEPMPDSEAAWLTLKAPSPCGDDRTRLEFEYLIPAGDAEQLLTLCHARIDKQRFGLDLPGGAWVLDVFAGANAPLVLAEVELEHRDQAVVVPPWCVLEITGRHELSNAALAHRPLAAWTESERESLLAWRKGQAAL